MTKFAEAIPSSQACENGYKDLDEMWLRQLLYIWLRQLLYIWNEYAGKETTVEEGTFGKRVVRKLCCTIKESFVTLALERFFTSVSLMDTLLLATVGTCMKNCKKNLPIMNTVLQRSEADFSGNNKGILAARWIDTKEVFVLSNCYNAGMTEVNKKQKDRSTKEIPCPEAIRFYRKVMGKGCWYSKSDGRCIVVRQKISKMVEEHFLLMPNVLKCQCIDNLQKLKHYPQSP